MKRTLQVLNLFTLLLCLGVNYFYNSSQSVSASMKSISGKYDNLLTPAGYAFSIWGLIYLGLFGFALYQARSFFIKNVDDAFVERIGPWFILANVFNALWVIAFTQDHIGLSVILMILLFGSLLKIILNLDMELWDAPFITILAIWWPFSLYFGWVNVALAANISVYLVSLGYTGDPIGATTWAVLILVVIGIIAIAMIWTRNMREYASAAVWGLIAIGVRNSGVNQAVTYTAYIVSAIVILNVVAHGYKNRAYVPIRSLRPKVK
jgi:riboflavin transporter FmnP